MGNGDIKLSWHHLKGGHNNNGLLRLMLKMRLSNLHPHFGARVTIAVTKKFLSHSLGLRAASSEAESLQGKGRSMKFHLKSYRKNYLTLVLLLIN